MIAVEKEPGDDHFTKLLWGLSNLASLVIFNYSCTKLNFRTSVPLGSFTDFIALTAMAIKRMLEL